MKGKRLSQTIAIILLAASLACVPLYAHDASLELTRALSTTKATTITLKADAGVAKALLRLTQDEGNRLVLEAPPSFGIDIGETLLAGELRTKGLLSLLLDPFSGPIPYKGFEKASNIAVANPLSLKPRISGLAFCGEWMDVVALSQTFNPSSPTGLGVVLGSPRAFVSFLAATQNERMLLKATPDMQVDWRRLGMGRHMFLSMVGTAFSGKVGAMAVEGAFFVQNAWDLNLGGGTSVGLGVGLGLAGMSIGIERRLGGVGITLKTLYEEHRPIEELSISCELGTSFGISCAYSSRTFAAPLYGGRSQERTERFGTSLRHRGLSVEVEGNLLFESDRGRRSYTNVEIGVKGVAGKDADIGLRTRIERSQGMMQSIGDTTLTFSCRHAKLKAKGGEVALEYSYSVPLTCDRTLEVSVNQDRTVTLRLSLDAQD